MDHTQSHELWLIRAQTKHKEPEHTYTKFWTPLTPFVVKILNRH